ncbi:histidinol dehydrogenase [Actinobacillus pleuropneumoniae]|nr:histidinol dehydrogenase [Actinobacillus pleuropneumoniae]
MQSPRTQPIFIAESLEQAVEISNEYAPEHLVVQVENARSLLDKLDNAGSIFLGAYSPEVWVTTQWHQPRSADLRLHPHYIELRLSGFQQTNDRARTHPAGFKDLAKRWK